MTNEEAKLLKNSILSDNKILYCMKDKPMTMTTMCWGLEIDNGWIHIVDEMSKQLEALNYMFYPKFRVRIQMEQVKEKYGRLTCYYSIICDPPKLICILKDCIYRIFEKISKLDFKILTVLDCDAHDEIEEIELSSKEEFEKEKKNAARICNVDIFEKDGKFIKRTIHHKCRKIHCIATKHRFLYNLLKKRFKIENFLINLLKIKPTYKQKCIEKYLYEKAKRIVNAAEDRCYNVCEICGHSITDDNDYSPRCTTIGWIKYICKNCADKSGDKYLMNGAIWKDGIEVLSKEERDKQIEEMNKKISEKLNKNISNEEAIENEDQI